jgi:hypothetical protein
VQGGEALPVEPPLPPLAEEVVEQAWGGGEGGRAVPEEEAKISSWSVAV